MNVDLFIDNYRRVIFPTYLLVSLSNLVICHFCRHVAIGESTGMWVLAFPRAFVLSEYEQSQLKYKLNFPILFSMLACCSTSHLQDCYIISCILINVSCLLFALFFVFFSFNHFTSSKLIKSKMQGGCWEWKKQGGQ